MDVNLLFAKAEASFQAGRLDEALDALDRVQRATGDHAAVLHLLALVHKRRGDGAASERAFVRALGLSPGDPQINNNYANLLDQAGRLDEALARYDRALGTDPRFADAMLNRGLLLQRLGRLEEALSACDAVLALQPRSARAHSARGSMLRELGRYREAAAAYEAALALAPNHPKALDGRARVALEAGEAGASTHFRRALATQPGSPVLTLGMAEALEAEGDAQALPFLAAAVAAAPDWIEGQERLAQMRSETGDTDHFTHGYHDALARNPGDRALQYSHWRALASAGRHDEALDAIERARAVLSEDRDMRLMHAVFLGEAGEPARAREMLTKLDDSPEVRTALARMLLRLGEARQAAALFERIVAEAPGDISAWAHLSLAWRLSANARHEWLCDQPGLFGTVELGLGAVDLAALAALLRSLHKTSAHPIGQSLRGGTQTRGRLLRRGEPEVVQLREAIENALRQFVATLPAADETHPLLRYRNHTFSIEGSWSVRLKSSGFHVSHIHPQGVLSSACYVALPDSLGGEGSTDGWLELGAPPAELGLRLPALAVIEPMPGRLALFPSYLYHGTRPFSAGERLTVAFDVVPG